MTMATREAIFLLGVDEPMSSHLCTVDEAGSDSLERFVHPSKSVVLADSIPLEDSREDGAIRQSIAKARRPGCNSFEPVLVHRVRRSMRSLSNFGARTA
jgi:hypothetical protein